MISERSAERTIFDDSPATHDAPSFELPGTDGSGWNIHRLSDYTTRGIVALGFYPADSLEDAEPLSWLDLTEGVDVLVVTNERCSAFGTGSPFPRQSFSLLCDPEEEVARKYGVDYRDPATRKLFLIDSSREILDAWTHESEPSSVYTRMQEHVPAPKSSPHMAVQRGGD